jgi:hypothetical protein
MAAAAPLRRLLNVFPVSSLRGQWKVKGRTKLDVIDDVVSNISVQNIANFVEGHMGLTKQHIHLFEHDLKQLSALPQSVLSYGPDHVTMGASTAEFFYLIPLEFQYVAGSPPERGTIEFPWPVHIIFRKAVLEVHLTTMEKDLEAYLEGKTPVFSSWRDLENKDILQDLKETLSPKVSIAPLDINKGVKHHWAADVIDAPRVAWKSPIATKFNAMDGDFLVKRDDPAEYSQAVLAPLLRTVFKVMDIDSGWPEILMIDPTGGEIGIPRYSKDVKAVANALREILEHN